MILYIVLGLAVGVGGLGLVGTFGILSFLGMPLLIIGLSLISAGVGPTSARATGVTAGRSASSPGVDAGALLARAGRRRGRGRQHRGDPAAGVGRVDDVVDLEVAWRR